MSERFHNDMNEWITDITEDMSGSLSVNDILEALNNEGGITVELRGERVILPSFTKGYWVGTETRELIHKVAFALTEFVINRVISSASQNGIDYLGFWLDGNWLHVDKVVHYTNKEKALKLAKAYGEKAIYSIHEQKDIYVDRL